jgi:hypothetical protein
MDCVKEDKVNIKELIAGRTILPSGKYVILATEPQFRVCEVS